MNMAQAQKAQFFVQCKIKLWDSPPMDGLEAKYKARQKEDFMKKWKSLKT